MKIADNGDILTIISIIVTVVSIIVTIVGIVFEYI